MISPPYVKFRKRVWDTIKVRCILYFLCGLLLLFVNRGQDIAKIIAIILPVIFITMLSINSYNLNKYYLTLIDINKSRGVIKLKVNKFDQFEFEKEIFITNCHLEYSQLANHIKPMYRLQIFDSYQIIFSQANVGSWTEQEFKNSIQILNSIR